MTLKIVLFLTTLSACACATLPPPPRHIQYGIQPDITPPGFYGVDSGDKSHHYEPLDSMKMKGGQCVSASDYKELMDYVDFLKEEARKRCK